MKYLTLFLLIFIISCGYPDSDTVPDFKDVTISQEEAIDLCKVSNNDNKSISECIKAIKISK